MMRFLLLIGCGKESLPQENSVGINEKVNIKFIFPDGIPALSVLGMYSENKQFEDSVNIEYEKAATAETLSGSLLSTDENIIYLLSKTC